MQVVIRSRTLDPDNLGSLADWLAGAVGARRVSFAEATLLTGGAVQENWRLVVDVEGGPREGRHVWVLRTDAIARLSLSLDRTAEFGVLKAAHAAGISVAEPIARCYNLGQRTEIIRIKCARTDDDLHAPTTSVQGYYM